MMDDGGTGARNPFLSFFPLRSCFVFSKPWFFFDATELQEGPPRGLIQKLGPRSRVNLNTQQLHVLRCSDIELLTATWGPADFTPSASNFNKPPVVFHHGLIASLQLERKKNLFDSFCHTIPALCSSTVWKRAVKVGPCAIVAGDLQYLCL